MSVATYTITFALAGHREWESHSIDAASLRGAKVRAAKLAPANACHAYIDDETGKTLAMRDALNTSAGCWPGGWAPWVTY